MGPCDRIFYAPTLKGFHVLSWCVPQELRPSAVGGYSCTVVFGCSDESMFGSSRCGRSRSVAMSGLGPTFPVSVFSLFPINGIETCVAPRYVDASRSFLLFSPNEQRGGGVGVG